MAQKVAQRLRSMQAETRQGTLKLNPSFTIELFGHS
jgi:hypothetical protein